MYLCGRGCIWSWGSLRTSHLVNYLIELTTPNHNLFVKLTPTNPRLKCISFVHENLTGWFWVHPLQIKNSQFMYTKSKNYILRNHAQMHVKWTLQRLEGTPYIYSRQYPMQPLFWISTIPCLMVDISSCFRFSSWMSDEIIEWYLSGMKMWWICDRSLTGVVTLCT